MPTVRIFHMFLFLGFGSIGNHNGLVGDLPLSLRTLPMDRVSSLTLAKGVTSRSSFTHVIAIEASIARICLESNQLKMITTQNPYSMRPLLRKFAPIGTTILDGITQSDFATTIPIICKLKEAGQFLFKS